LLTGLLVYYHHMANWIASESERTEEAFRLAAEAQGSLKYMVAFYGQYRNIPPVR